MQHLEPADWRIIEAIETGLPLVSRPYLVIGAQAGLSEAEVISRLGRLIERGVIKRFGVVVRHRSLGYRANAMVVWDVPDDQVEHVARRMREFDFITLCYRRPRRLPEWRYNLFTMIHGQDRASVLYKVQHLADECCLSGTPHQALFSQRCFKQCGARYAASPARSKPAEALAPVG